MLTRDAILSAPLPAPAPLDVPEWGGQVALRTLTLAEALSFSAIPATDIAQRAVVIVRMAMVRPDGERLFTEADDAWLASLPWELLRRLAWACLGHNGLTAAAQEQAAGN